MKIVFLHLSDMHMQGEYCANDDAYLSKIVASLKCYGLNITDLVLIVSGDITFSGQKKEFNNAQKMIDTIIDKIRVSFKNCSCHVLVIPGNHDVTHDNNFLPLEKLKKHEYVELEASEYSKLEEFYAFSANFECFTNREVYYERKNIEINGFQIQANLLNNAIFSTNDEYQGLLYISEDTLEALEYSANADLVIMVMHHAPSFYRDDIENYMKEKIIGKNNILFYGHEHRNRSENTSYDDSNPVIVQLGGCLIKDGDWTESSYQVGILDTEKMEYKHKKFKWNRDAKQYEHGDSSVATITRQRSILPISDEFKDFLYDEDYKKGYFVFPMVLLHGLKSENPKQFESFDSFLKEILQHQKVMIIGRSNVGKSTLLKKLFEALNKDYIILFCSSEKILNKSKNKKQNTEKLIKEFFQDAYDDNNSRWQFFEQCDKSKCVFIFDDFDQAEGIDTHKFMKELNDRFGVIILTSSKMIEFEPHKMICEDDEIAKFEIKPHAGEKRKQLIKAVVSKKADDKSDLSINQKVNEINQLIKTQISLIPPEPYYVVRCAEYYINSVGDVVSSGVNIFSKVFEASITTSIDTAIKNLKKHVTVDLMFFIIGKIAYHIHFHRAYPIDRRTIDRIIQEYNDEYGNSLITQDIIDIVKKARILSEESSESFRFTNKSLLAYFIAKEIIGQYHDTKDDKDIKDIINKSCVNICTDVLLFIIFQTDDTYILTDVLTFIDQIIENDSRWVELDVDNMPNFLKSSTADDNVVKPANLEEEKKQIKESEEKAEEIMLSEFKIKDIYDWDDADIEKFSSQLIRIASLLHILSKSLPSFEHKLKKPQKKRLIEYLYKLPNMIFMFWAREVDKTFNDFIEELKLLPYMPLKKSRIMDDKQLTTLIRADFAKHAINLLLSLYFIPVINAVDRNTSPYLTNPVFFNFKENLTYKLEYLMILEQVASDDDFTKYAIELFDESRNYPPFKIMLSWIVRHAIITKLSKRENIQKLEQKFFLSTQKQLFIEREKNKSLKE